jgi:uncharacterized protein YqeY
MMMSLTAKITDDMKTAMRAKDSARLGAIRLLLAAIKQREVDERIELDNTQIVTVIDKMLKQRRDSITQFEAAGRQELADIEKFEIGILQAYMPQAASAGEIDSLIIQAITNTGATGIKDMGKVMAILKTQLAGRADMAQVSTHIKAKLAG